MSIEDSHGRGPLWMGLRGAGRSTRLAEVAAAAEGLGHRVLRLRLSPGIGLAELLTAAEGNPGARLVGEWRLAAKAGKRLVLCIDDLHHLVREEALALAAALESEPLRSARVLLAATALPSLWSQLGPVFGRLQQQLRLIELAPLGQEEAAAIAISIAQQAQRKFATPALLAVLDHGHGSPVLLSAWARHAAQLATETVIRAVDVGAAEARVHAELDGHFYREVAPRIGASERAYLLAMAGLGDGAQRSGDIAAALGKRVTQVAPVRAQLMARHILYAPRYGYTACTAPAYGAHLRRRYAGPSAASMSSAISAGASFGA